MVVKDVKNAMSAERSSTMSEPLLAKDRIVASITRGEQLLYLLTLPDVRNSYFTDELLAMGVLFRVELIGRECEYLDEALKAQYGSEAMWCYLADVTHNIIYESATIDLEEALKWIEEELPEVLNAFKEIYGNKYGSTSITATDILKNKFLIPSTKDKIVKLLEDQQIDLTIPGNNML